MTELRVEVVKVGEIHPHPNADRLEITKVWGWDLTIPKGLFAADTYGVYFPIDSVLPTELEKFLFPEGSKFKLTRGRIRAERIRGMTSYGLLVSLTEIVDYCFVHRIALPPLLEGVILTSLLGVTKYEPSPHVIGQPARSARSHRRFARYTDIQNARYHPSLFSEGEKVVVTEKVHGSNLRAGWVEAECGGWWQRLRRWLFPSIHPMEWVYGSHNVELRPGARIFYDSNIYEEMVRKYDLKKILPPGVVIYGEVYGSGVQRGYSYGLGKGERKAVFFDATLDGYWLDWPDFFHLCSALSLPIAPVLYIGGWEEKKVTLQAEGPSVLADLHGEKVIREGAVVKSYRETQCHIGRKILKMINPAYLIHKEP